jgi:predicted metal-binding membrane protein
MAVGVAAFPLGAAFAEFSLRLPALARAVPVLTGATVFAAGLLQCSDWKARHLAWCRAAPSAGISVRPGAAWRYGFRLGLHCLGSCAPQLAVLLAAGVMELTTMALVTASITAERLVPDGKQVARVTGAVFIATGLWLALRAVGIG